MFKIINIKYNNNPIFKIISIAPLSSKGEYKTHLDYELKKDREPVKEDCYVRLYLIQPILKVGLTKLKGEISKNSIEEIKAILVYYFGF